MAGLGVSYPPPNELLPIFNNTVYSSETSEKLNYPIAQGAETIPNLTTTNLTVTNMTTPIKSLTSPFYNFMSVREAGVYLCNGTSFALYYMFPLYRSGSYTNFYNSTITTGAVPATDGVFGVNGKGNYQIQDYSLIDEAYLVYPKWGIQVYAGAVNNVDVVNNTSYPFVVRTPTVNINDSCKIYYNGVEVTA